MLRKRSYEEEMIRIYADENTRSSDFMLTPNQVKMARVALDWTTQDLARAAGVNHNTVNRFENGGNVTLATIGKIKAALELVGITFIPANGGPATVRPPPDREG